MPKNRNEDLIAALESRKGLYRLFNRFFLKEIDQSFLQGLQNSQLMTLLEQLNLPELNIVCTEAGIIDQLATEFTRLFIGPGRHLSPHESIQRKTGGLLNDDDTVKVRRFIEASGFSYISHMQHFPDHICAEFEFMEALIQKQIEALSGGDFEEAETSEMLQQEFLQRHILQWVPQFCKKIENEAELPIYPAVAQAVSAFIQSE
ncbi:hypothetical protein MNBD_ALPHA02-2052 [hydrothermal vent metagenome]|uniref:Oxidoreductase component of anaerobic dehydrogenases Chaperone protein TorD n=1 Tax=hydrothermal vent metagenome TaxID=652676 RepID=A0A3B0S4T9_9ZZZZ